MTHVGLVAPLDEIEGDPDLVAAPRRARGGRARARRHRAQLAELLPHAGHRRDRRARVVTGPAVAIPGFVERLSEQLRLPLEAGVVGEPARTPADPSA